MLTIDKSPAHILALRLSGTVEKEDIQKIESAYADKKATQDRMGFLVDMTDWSDMTADALAEDVKFELRLLNTLRSFPKMAIVSKKQFVAAIMNFLNPLFPMIEIRCFGPEDYDRALTFAGDFPHA